jgi:hypothetical protein
VLNFNEISAACLHECPGHIVRVQMDEAFGQRRDRRTMDRTLNFQANDGSLLRRRVTERTVRSDLLALVEQGLVVRRGQGPSTIYSAADGSAGT